MPTTRSASTIVSKKKQSLVPKQVTVERKREQKHGIALKKGVSVAKVLTAVDHAELALDSSNSVAVYEPNHEDPYKHQYRDLSAMLNTCGFISILNILTSYEQKLAFAFDDLSNPSVEFRRYTASRSKDGIPNGYNSCHFRDYLIHHTVLV